MVSNFPSIFVDGTSVVFGRDGLFMLLLFTTTVICTVELYFPRSDKKKKKAVDQYKSVVKITKGGLTEAKVVRKHPLQFQTFLPLISTAFTVAPE